MGLFAWLANSVSGGCDSPEAPAAWPEAQALGPGAALRSALSPDGQRLGLGSTRGLTVYDTRSLQPLWRRPGGAVRDLSFSADGAWLASASDDGKVQVHAVGDGGLRYEGVLPGLGANSASVALSPDGAQLAWAYGAQAGLLSLPQGEAHTLLGAPTQASRLRWSADGKQLAAGDIGGGARVWTAPAEGAMAQAVPGAAVHDLAFSPDSQRLLLAAQDLSLWSADGAQALGRFPLPSGRWAQSVSWSPDGASWLLGLDGGWAQTLDASSGAALSSIDGLLSAVTVAEQAGGWTLVQGDHPTLLGPDGQRRALPSIGSSKSLSWSPDRAAFALVNRSQATVLSWPDGALLGVVPSTLAYAEGGLWTQDGTLLLRSSKQLIAWRQGAQVWTLSPPEGAKTLDGVAAHPKQAALAVASTIRRSTLKVELNIQLYSSQDGQLLRTLVVDSSGQTSAQRLEYSPDGRWLAAQGGELVRIYDAETGALQGERKGVNGELGGFAWDPQGRWLASGTKDRAVVLWDPQTGEVLRQLLGELPGQGAWILSVSPSGDFIAAVSRGRNDDRLHLWRSESGEPVPLEDPLASLGQQLSFSPDSALLALSVGQPGGAGLVRFIDTGTGRTVHALRSPKGYGMALGWTPDGAALLDLAGLLLQRRP